MGDRGQRPVVAGQRVADRHRRDELTNKQFRKIVRLVKYLKRERGSFNGVRCVVLTTLLGLQVTELNSLAPGRYSNTPTALVNIIEDLDRYLQAQGSTRPHLANPSGDGTDFDHRWTDETYRNRDRLHVIAADIRSAYNETDSEKSIAAWRDVFGAKFNPPTTRRPSTSANRYVAAPSIAGAGASSRSGRSG